VIIDAHMHLGRNAYAGGWIGSEDLSAVDRFTNILHTNGVDKGFTFTSAGLRQDPKQGNDDLARARDQHPEAIIPWGTVNPHWEEKRLRTEMRRCVEELGFEGFKFVPWVQGFSMVVGGMSVVAQECIRMDVPVTFHDGSPLYCTALQIVYFARAHPGLRVLSAHAGLREGWRDTIQPCRELPNYWLCLSGPTQQGIQAIYDELGPDKLLFGSDAGSSRPEVQANYLRRIRALNAPQKDIDKILGLNALRFLKLKGCGV